MLQKVDDEYILRQTSLVVLYEQYAQYWKLFLFFLSDKGLNIFWCDDSLSCFPWFWLRDHSESKEDLHPDTKQRQIDSFSEPLNNIVTDICLDGSSESIFIKWSDQSESSLSFELLQKNADV